MNYIDGYVGWEKVETESLLWFSDNEMFYPFKEIYGEMNFHFSPLNLDLRVMTARSTEMVEKYEENILELTETHPLFGHTLELINWFKRDLFTIPTQLTLNLPTGHEIGRAHV